MDRRRRAMSGRVRVPVGTKDACRLVNTSTTSNFAVYYYHLEGEVAPDLLMFETCLLGVDWSTPDYSSLTYYNPEYMITGLCLLTFQVSVLVLILFHSQL